MVINLQHIIHGTGPGYGSLSYRFASNTDTERGQPTFRIRCSTSGNVDKSPTSGGRLSSEIGIKSNEILLHVVIFPSLLTYLTISDIVQSGRGVMYGVVMSEQLGGLFEQNLEEIFFYYK